MRKILPKNITHKLLRAIVEFDMIVDGDRIMIGLSGGKDSLFLTYCLAILHQHTKRNFELAAITIDPMFHQNTDFSALSGFCNDLGIPFHSVEVDIAGILAQPESKDACFSCAFFRRGALNRFAVENGFNKIALAHHQDDVVETFFMSMLSSGQLKTFLPVTYMDRTGITAIRPLIYFREREIIENQPLHGFEPIASPCPYNGKTRRQDTKELIKQLESTNPSYFHHLFAALHQDAVRELWPEELTGLVMKTKHQEFWKPKKGC